MPYPSSKYKGHREALLSAMVFTYFFLASDSVFIACAGVKTSSC